MGDEFILIKKIILTSIVLTTIKKTIRIILRSRDTDSSNIRYENPNFENVPKILEEIDDTYRRDGTAAHIIAEERAQRAEGGERAREGEEGGMHGAQSAIS